MDELFGHYLKPDHNGEPVCACGYDPARAEPPADNRGDAVHMVYVHKDQAEAALEC